MKQLLLASVLMLLSISMFAQTAVTEYRIDKATVTTFTVNLPIGSKIYQIDTRQYWVVIAPITAGGTLAAAIAANSVKELGSITLGTVGTETIKVRTTTLSEDAVATQQIIIPKATEASAGLITASDQAKLNAITPGAVGIYTVEATTVGVAPSQDVTLAHTPKNATSILVDVNGVPQKRTSPAQYSIAANVVTIAAPLLENDVVTVSYSY